MVKPDKLFWKIAVFSVLKKLVWVVLIGTTTVFAQKENKYIRSGNDLYDEKNYKDAEVNYMKALEKNPESFKGQYNLGSALYKQDNYEDASKLYNNLAGKGEDAEQKANGFYNLGNSLVKAKKYPEGIEAYKNALRLNPGDADAKYNMEFAKRMLKEEQNQKQNKNQNQEPSEYAKKLKKQADELVLQRKYKDAYDLMKNGEKVDKTVLYFQDFTQRINDVVGINN